MRSHQLPLTSLVNLLEQTEQTGGPVLLPNGDSYVNPELAWVQNICPMHEAPPTEVMGPGLPYSTVEALIDHANEVLERLDHEYSAKGGLLGILPPKEEKENRALAETTLLGQMVLYMQRLVQRLHDLERLYANAQDCLATEAVAVHQALSTLGPDGRQPREMVYPQDRFVLVNAGEEVWKYLTDQFDAQDTMEETVAQHYRRKGAAAESLWRTGEAGKIYSRGITAIDINTRYYRLREDPLKTIFVIPAHGKHPGVSATRKMEKDPTVVSVVKPVWPERASQWEMNHRQELAQARLDRDALRNLQATTDQLIRERDAAVGSKAIAVAKARDIEKTLHNAMEDPNTNLKQCQEALTNLKVQETRLAEERKQLDEQKHLFEEQKKAHARLEKQLNETAKQQDAAAKRAQDEAATRAENLRRMDREAAASGHALTEKLQALWCKQLQEVAEMKAHLSKKGVAFNTNETLDPLTPRDDAFITQQIKDIVAAQKAEDEQRNRGTDDARDSQMGGT
ncbi:uncharacterized protein L3040_004748 [Drepanopeziza brunnea f. sp. 'multigermtubi']|nr:hypothetical protein L3040_004748 [Drepanopeziza brunnea f. sp. 'multigermtubi']